MTITFGANGVEAVARSLGGELISYKKDGKEYVWTGDEKYWTGRAPALFPFVSALEDGKVLIDGKECVMPAKHGFIRTNDLKLIEADDKKVVFELCENQSTLANYPYRFSFKITHEVCEKGFKTTYTVTNPDSKPLPFCIGAHPGFLLEDGIENYKLVFEKEESCALGYTDEKSMYSDSYVLDMRLEGKEWNLCYKDFDVDAIFFKGLKSRKVSIVEKATGNIRLTFDFNGFDEFIIWTAPGKNAPYLCLEPWNGLPAVVGETGRFEDKPYLRTLGKGESYSVSYSMEI